MPSQVDICNLSLSHIGEKTIASMTEKTVEALTLSEFWNMALYETLRDFSWPFATKYDNLSLVVTNPNMNWQYAYQYPSDCLFFRRILSGFHQDSPQQKVPFILAKSNFIAAPLATTPVTFAGGAGLFIFTNWQYAQGEYTYLVQDTSTMTPDFILAFSFRLAAYIVPRLTGGDPFKLKPDMLQSYDVEITKAKANSFNEEQQPQELPSEFTRSRDGVFYDQGQMPAWFAMPSGWSIQ